MVDVGRKPVTSRTAVARGSITMSAVAFRSIAHGKVAKGDVLNIARIAGIMAAKKTPDLIPLCHPLSISSVTVDFDLDESSNTIVIESQVTVSGRTGVEMEALTAVSVAALTIYDMCKAIDKRMVISQIALVFKKGGKSGDFQR